MLAHHSPWVVNDAELRLPGEQDLGRGEAVLLSQRRELRVLEQVELLAQVLVEVLRTDNTTSAQARLHQ